MRIGVIAEGPTDVPVFEGVVVRPGRGKPSFLSVFPPLLWTFEHVEPGGRPEKAIVIRDANGDDPAAVEGTLAKALTGRRVPPFHAGVRFHATRRETETWLLADVGAINRVAARYGGGAVAAIPGPLEDIVDAKEQFIRLLANAGLPNVPEIVREVTREVALAVLRLHSRLRRYRASALVDASGNAC